MSSTCKIKIIRKSDIKISKNTFEYSDNFTDFLMLRCIHNNKLKINK